MATVGDASIGVEVSTAFLLYSSTEIEAFVTIAVQTALETMERTRWQKALTLRELPR